MDGEDGTPQASEPTVDSTVVVIDDHRVFAEMLSAALDGVPGLSCVGVASSAAEGVTMVMRLQPDIVVMDINMPREDGLAATARIRAVAPDAVVAVVTAFTSPEWVSKAAQAGASAFIPKNGSLSEMVGILRRVQPGGMVVAPSAFAPAAASVAATAQPTVGQPALSSREVDVLRMLADGVPVREMAPALGITLNTCRGYIKVVRQKLKANSQLEAVLKARELGLLD